MASKFGQLLLWGNLITEEQLQDALEHQREHGGKLGEILSRLGHISDDDVTRTLGMKYGVPTINLDRIQIEQETLHLIPSEMAYHSRVIPISRVGSTLTCAMEDPTRIDIINEVEFQTGLNLQPVLVTAAVMTAALARYYPAPSAAARAAQLSAPTVVAKTALIASITHRLQQLPPDKLESVRRFLDSLQ